MKQRAYCFTVNAENAVKTWGLPQDTSKIRYACWQLEQGVGTGRPHIQGYCEFTVPMRVSAVKGLFKCPTMHLEARMGTRDQARAYCMKEATRLAEPFEFGEWNSGQGKRNDLTDACKIMKTDGMHALIDSNPGIFVRYSRGLKELQFQWNQAAYKSTRLALKVIAIWGATGIGKTRCALEYASSKTWYKLDMSANGSTLWWDGYQGEDVLVVDDFYGWVPYGKLLNLLDIYPVRLDVKGSHAWANWTKVIITSNKAPDDWYPNVAELGALHRRIHHTFHPETSEDVPDLTAVFDAVGRDEVGGNTSPSRTPPTSP